MLSLFRLFTIATLLAAIAWPQFANSPPVLGATSSSAWTQPASPAMHNLGLVQGLRAERAEACTQLTYRQVDDVSKKMRTGCFTNTTFGLYDSVNSMAIFKGTDEAVPLYYNGQPAALTPLPATSNMLRFSSAPGAGAYAYMYTHLPAVLDENRMLPTLWRYKEIASLPNSALFDTSGKLLRINTAAMGFSSRSQWIVADSPSKSLIRINLSTHAITPFAESLSTSGTSTTHTAAMAITDDGRYAAAVSREHAFFRVYDLHSCTGDSGTDSLFPLDCQYYDYWDYFKSQLSGNLLAINQLTFVRQGLLSFVATTSVGSEQYLLAPNGPIDSLVPYLGLGDSFASGQGAFNYLSGTDTATNHCHLSIHSYPLLLNSTVFSSGGRSVACSGARIHDITNTSSGYTGQTSDQRTAADRQADGSEATVIQAFTPGNIAQQRFVTSYQPGVITVQISGNDIGFGSILKRCISPIARIKPLTFNENHCYKSYEDRLEVMQLVDRTYPRLVNLYNRLQRESPLSRVYAVGYPQILSAKGDCKLNTPLTLEDIAFAREVTYYLNEVIQQAAEASGIHYISISDALVGYELCSGNTALPAMNGITAGNDSFWLGQESFHPTAFGHELIAQRILQATNNFAIAQAPQAKPDLPSPVVSTTEPTLSAPSTGRAVRFIHPAKVSQENIVVKGNDLHISAAGNEYFIRPNSSYTVAINDTPVYSGRTDNTGELGAIVTIPTTVPAGPGYIDITVPNQNDETLGLQDEIFIGDSPDDHDGDGIPNGSDSCPGTVNAQVDTDSDNVDDACDNSLSPPETPPHSSEQEAESTAPKQNAQNSTQEQGTAKKPLLAAGGLQVRPARSQRVTAIKSSNTPRTTHAVTDTHKQTQPSLDTSHAWQVPPRFAWWWVIIGILLVMLFMRVFSYCKSRSYLGLS